MQSACKLSTQEKWCSKKKPSCIVIKNKRRNSVENKLLQWESENITQSSSAKPKELVNKPIHSKNNNNNNQKKRNKQKTKQNKTNKKKTAKCNWKRILLRKCHLKLKTCSNSYDLNILSLVLYCEVICPKGTVHDYYFEPWKLIA